MPEESQKISWSKKTVKALIEGKLDDAAIRDIQRMPKDEDRFEKVIEAEQERVPWKERILVPLQEHLYVVQKGKSRIVKCFCGYEFGSYLQNWKLSALVYERDPSDGEVYSGLRASDPEWMILREFYCPGCGVQLDVEAVPPGYQFIFNQIPDIDGFYAKRPGLLERVLGNIKVG